MIRSMAASGHDAYVPYEGPLINISWVGCPHVALSLMAASVDPPCVNWQMTSASATKISATDSSMCTNQGPEAARLFGNRGDCHSCWTKGQV